MHPVSIVWFRRDLRLDDHVALRRAADASAKLVCAFVLDPEQLRGPRVGAPIVQAFFTALAALRAELRELGSDLALLEGDAAAELAALAERTGARALYYNIDYEPAALARDAEVTKRLREAHVEVHDAVDHVYYGAGDVVQESGKPYAVYTPYRKRWTARLAHDERHPVASRAAAVTKFLGRDASLRSREVPQPEEYGHASSLLYPTVTSAEAHRLLDEFVACGLTAYADRRNVPALDATSRLSPHLRAGTIGIRTVVAAALERRRISRAQHAVAGIDAWLGELIWRDFYGQLLAHRPQVAQLPFIEAAETIPYRDDPDGYRAWCEGRTGYPIVDAAMRQLRETGWMHNRLRMIVASFLTKHLLIDYHEGERWFEQRLADADLAANNGGWQWAASTGTDAAPYFRVFNPTLQGKTYDPDGTFVRRWVPELQGVPAEVVHEPGLLRPPAYPPPIVEHAAARQRAIDVYGGVLRAKGDA
ncbi:MAG TPA: deoxyribodipyrimidine photo-lyase [Candidatus Elarobacter sp.]